MGLKQFYKIGSFQKVIGVDGYIRAIISTNVKFSWDTTDFIYINTEGQYLPLFIEDIEVLGDEIILKFEEIDQREHALQFVAKPIYQDKALMEIDDSILNLVQSSEFVGWSVYDSNSKIECTVIEVLEMPGQQMLNCEVEDKTVFIPLNQSLISKIDNKLERIVMNLPLGIFEQ